MPYLAPHMGPWLILLCVIAIGIGLACADRSVPESDDSLSPNTYTIENVRPHRDHYVEQDGVVQAFTLLETHPQSGYFHIEVTPPDEHQLDRNYPRIRGWTKEISSSRFIRQEDLLRELPLEVRRIFSF